MPAAVRAVRGATTVDLDTEEQVTTRVQALLDAILERNGLAKDDLISIVFTATDDVVSMFPAAAARAMGLGTCRSCAHGSSPWPAASRAASAC